MATQTEVSFEPTATPNFPMPEGKWVMVLMENLQEVPSHVHSFQVPFYRWSEAELQAQADSVAASAQAAHPDCADVRVVVSRGTGQWDGMVGVHAEGSL
jgi:hypothetical protein